MIREAIQQFFAVFETHVDAMTRERPPAGARQTGPDLPFRRSSSRAGRAVTR